MLLKRSGDGNFRFHNESTIRMTLNGSEMEESDIVIIDEASWFEDEKLVEILGKCNEYCDVKVLTSANENGGEEYNKLIKNPDYTYLRYAIEED
jgi:thymidine kinase